MDQSVRFNTSRAHLRSTCGDLWLTHVLQPRSETNLSKSARFWGKASCIIPADHRSLSLGRPMRAFAHISPVDRARFGPSPFVTSSDPVLSPFKSKHMARLWKLSRVKWPCAKPASRWRNWENVGFSEGKRPTGTVNICSGRSVSLNKRPLFV